jgi:hypothetical protein
MGTARSAIAVATILAAGLAGGAEAQNAGAVVGRVLEFSSDSVVAQARVELLDSRQRRVAMATADAAGAFRFAELRPGTYHLRATASGYREVMTPDLTVAGEAVHVVVRMGIDVVPLAPLEVTTRPAAAHRNVALAGFLDRAERRMGGAFILLDEIEERQPRHITDLIRVAGSMTVIDHARGGIVLNNRTQCAPSVYIDGRFIAGSYPGTSLGGERVFDAINSVHWSQVEGIEVYSGVSTVPAEFSGSRAGCGVVAIWLRRG